MNSIKNNIDNLFKSQIQEWDLAKVNFRKLENCKIKELPDKDFPYTLQTNSGRIKSALSKTDRDSISNRPCFLCKQNRPIQQKYITYNGTKNNYEILINPFPIFKKHFTIVDTTHTNQTITDREQDFLDITDIFEDYVIFFNGAQCGASAPDHMHFQAGNKDLLPIIRNFSKIEANSKKLKKDTYIYRIDNMPFTGFFIKSLSKQKAIKNLELLIKCIGSDKKLNILSWKNKNEYIIVLFPRTKHRPSTYYAKGSSQKLISPASIEMGGLIITPLEKDFNNTTYTDLEIIFKEICYSKDQIDNIVQKIQQS